MCGVRVNECVCVCICVRCGSVCVSAMCLCVTGLVEQLVDVKGFQLDKHQNIVQSDISEIHSSVCARACVWV